MIASIIFILLTMPHGEIEPIYCHPGDPVINLEVSSLDGKLFQLKELVEDSIVIFLSLDCSYCQQGLPAIDNILANDTHCILLMTDKKENVLQKIDKTIPESLRSSIFVIKDLANLKPYNIKALPAVLAYKQSILSFAYHGPLEAKNCLKLLLIYNGHYTIKTK